MDVAKELFWADVDSGEVHIRDKWQFALKSDFFPHPGKSQNHYIQEFYLFIPNSLQINVNTYSKEQFYLDETNLIRFKTPEFTFRELLDLNEQYSPLSRVTTLCIESDMDEHRQQLSEELKLLANVVRSTLRKETKRLMQLLNSARVISSASKEFIEDVKELREHLLRLRELYAKAQRTFLIKWNDTIFYRQMLYIDEFLSDTIIHYMTGLLENLRLTSHEHLLEADRILSHLIIDETQISQALAANGEISDKRHSPTPESTLYRANLLNKFVLDALQLSTNRFSMDQRFQHWIGALSAGVAIMVYFSLFAWLGNVFVINSAPFLTIAAVFYILKDRIKDWLRAVSYQKASRWFPDYTTVIRALDSKRDLGVVKESCSFIAPEQLSSELKAIRNAEFHSVLESFQRPENVLFYKRVIEIKNPSKHSDPRRLGLNLIYRFNIQRLLHQAGDPIETHLAMEPLSHKLISLRLPKVYHLNLIIKSTSFDASECAIIEYQKLRLIVDKNGIKRIEQIS